MTEDRELECACAESWEMHREKEPFSLVPSMATWKLTAVRNFELDVRKHF